MANINRLHTALLNAVILAGANAVQKQKTARAEAKGQHKDVVTAIDRENEGRIRDVLRKIEPDISFLGEEEGLQTGKGKLLAVVDPLDATTNYALGRPEFSVIGAIVEDGIVEFGAICVPATYETFSAERGAGAFLHTIHGKTPVRVNKLAALSDAVISFNRSNFPPPTFAGPDPAMVALRMLGGIIKHARSYRNFGTAGFEYVDVARGRLDGVVTPIAEAVHVAGYLIMEEAGAKVTDLNGKPYALDSKTIVASCPEIHEQLLRALYGEY